MAGTISEAFYPVITVREFLQLIPKAKFELLAGEDGLDRKINRPTPSLRDKKERPVT